jgi:hypothetical protein
MFTTISNNLILTLATDKLILFLNILRGEILMGYLLREVKSKTELDETVDKYISSGKFKITKHTNDLAKLKQKTYGSFGGHFLVFILTAWFTACIGNILYALLSGEKVTIVVGEELKKSIEKQNQIILCVLIFITIYICIALS